MKRILLGSAAVLTIMFSSIAIAHADVLSQIEKRGTLVVGVKADYRPYGYLNPSNNIVGIEPDLARDVAKALGVQLKLVPVVASNRMQFLDQGRVDLLIATMTDTAERRNVVDLVPPDYYASGVNIMARKKSPFNNWESIKGAPVCAVQGSFFNEMVARKYGAKLVAFKGSAEALNALKQGRCAAFVFDDTFIAAQLQQQQWSAYDIPLKTIDSKPWGVAVKKGETRFARFMSGMVVHWHVDGEIIKLQKKYGLTPIAYSVRMHKFFDDNFVPSAN
ncbi:MAG: transporter substrate-binding domain-containing protein [Salinisphaera sp.]|jgi:polar amino acid transport system substrate-binding protein|nr:transporter substrate-binding domain-containing protein [Salinisphaera sp.]